MLKSGDLRVVRGLALVRMVGNDSAMWTAGPSTAIVVQGPLLDVCDDDIVDYDSDVYMMLFSVDSRLYYVAEDQLMSLDEAKNPGRLFGRLVG